MNEVAISDIDADYVMIWSDSGPILTSKITVGWTTDRVAERHR